MAALALLIAGFALASGRPAPAQLPDGSDQLNKILDEPNRLEELKKERLRPPIEFFRSQIMPNDILPYLKANHWAMVGLEMRANHEDYVGSLQTQPITLADQPLEMIYRRDARLIKGQRARLTMPMLLPVIPKEIGFQLVRPDAIRQDEDWPASLRVLEPHQQMIVVLSKSSNDQFARWSQSRSTLPVSSNRGDPLALDRQRYYRLVLPLEPDKPLLSAHPLTWSPISHLIWDGLPPEIIGTGQQQAIVDWLHWGGQLVITGGAGPAFAPLRESFLAPYLPADPSGENAMRTGAELKALSEAYPPSAPAADPDEPITAMGWDDAWITFGRRYKPPAPIPATQQKPLFVAGLTPKPGATVIPMGGEGGPPLGVEWKVGRGRVLMLGVSLSDPDLIAWPGYDTMVRRVVLRRPEELMTSPMAYDPNGLVVPPRYEPLTGPDLTTVRYLSRDLGAPTRVALDEDGKAAGPSTAYGTNIAGVTPYQVPVGEWLDSAELPRLCRDVLEKASGIEIPGRAFVLKVILAYILILVPLNYAICRYLLGRRELAWLAIPVLSLAFAIGVERAAAYDVGYDSSCDEVDLIETHGSYPRGHISRFASLYSNGRVKFSISYPNDPTALALPLATGRALRGEDATQASFQTQPIPALTGYQVQPRSLAMFRAEQMASLPGTVSLTPADQGPRTIVNESGLDLEDAWVVEVGDGKQTRGVRLGKVANGAKVPLGPLGSVEPKNPAGSGPLEPGPFLDLLLSRSVARSVASRPEEVGELRLIARADKPIGGQEIEPAVDRHRGFTLLVAHLQPAPLLGPDAPRYFALADGPEAPPIPLMIVNPPNPNANFRRSPRVTTKAVAPPLATPPPAGFTPAPPPSAGPAPPSNPNAPEAPRP